MASIEESDRQHFLPEIQRAQVRILFSSHLATTLANAMIAVSAAAVAIITHGPSKAVTIWLGVVLATLILRGVSVAIFARTSLVHTRPHLVLRTLIAGSLASGLTWTCLPFIIPNFDGSTSDVAILLVMLGISSGSVVRGIVCFPMSMVFALPIQSAIFISLLGNGSATAYILASNVFALVVILVRSSLGAQQTFFESEVVRLRATALADSLAQANEDITQANARLEQIANYDPVTGLANRASFNDRVATDLAAAARDKSEVALLLIDLDHFKQINDTLGHSAGDRVLKEIADRLTCAVQDHGMIARIGGDEFAVLVKGPMATVDARAYANRIIELSERPISVGGAAMVVHLSIGLGGYPHHAQNADDLLACADLALYAAKESGRRCVRAFDPAMKTHVERQRVIEQDLARAIEANALEVWFQPQMALDTREVLGFEALLRWFHPQLGSVSPPEVIQAAQSLHIADQLTIYIAHAVCRLLTELPELGLPEATVGLNISPREFAHYSVADVLQTVTEAHGITHSLLEIEITEEAILDAEGAGEQLKRMENAGFKLAVDDFGMGHSSLAYLISLQVDRLKIDRSFVQGVTGSRANQELILALVGLGHALSIEIVVEGVENQTDADMLLMLGCKIAQGYHFARPMSADALRAWLAARKSAVDTAEAKKAVA